MRSLVPGNGLNGSGSGIAILDSGIDPLQVALQDENKNSRIVANVDFTGEGRTDDPYGHGTHAAAGNGSVSASAYLGIAPNAKVVNVRVLNSTGTGTVSSLLAGLQCRVCDDQE